jgi:hypothetical protein
MGLLTCPVCQYVARSVRGFALHVRHLHENSVEVRISAFTNRSMSDECWEWTGSVGGTGYARVQVAGYSQEVTRLLLGLEQGDHRIKMHTCDNPPCVNPSHLLIGTPQDNNDDMWSKGRGKPPHGSSHHFAKLTEDDVLSIRTQVLAGSTQRVMGRRFGVDQSTISNIMTVSTWRQL